MKNSLRAVLAMIILAGSTALAGVKSVPDSGASGDMRRVLTEGLRAMQAVSVTTKYGGDYIGLYNVECKYAGIRAMLCTASDRESGETNRWNSDWGAVLVGAALKENVQCGGGAQVIRAKKVACNLVGDECVIEGVTIESYRQ